MEVKYSEVEEALKKWLNIKDIDNNPITKAILFTNAKQMLLSWFASDGRNCLISLKDMKTGFMTDRSKKSLKENEKLRPYSYNTLTQCATEALLSGLSLTNNEFKVVDGEVVANDKNCIFKIVDLDDLCN